MRPTSPSAPPHGSVARYPTRRPTPPTRSPRFPVSPPTASSSPTTTRPEAPACNGSATTSSPPTTASPTPLPPATPRSRHWRPPHRPEAVTSSSHPGWPESVRRWTTMLPGVDSTMSPSAPLGPISYGRCSKGSPTTAGGCTRLWRNSPDDASIRYGSSEADPTRIREPTGEDQGGLCPGPPPSGCLRPLVQRVPGSLQIPEAHVPSAQPGGPGQSGARSGGRPIFVTTVASRGGGAPTHPRLPGTFLT